MFSAIYPTAPKTNQTAFANPAGNDGARAVSDTEVFSIPSRRTAAPYDASQNARAAQSGRRYWLNSKPLAAGQPTWEWTLPKR